MIQKCPVLKVMPSTVEDGVWPDALVALVCVKIVLDGIATWKPSHHGGRCADIPVWSLSAKPTQASECRYLAASSGLGSIAVVTITQKSIAQSS